MTDRSKRRPLPPSPPDVDETVPTGPLPDDLSDAEVEEQTFVGGDAARRNAAGLSLLLCRLDGVDLSGTVLRRAHFRDVDVNGGSWANVEAPEAGFTRMTCRGVRATGVTFARAKLADVAFEDCRLDLSSFRFAALRRVMFRGCRMEEADFAGIRAADVLFDSCDLSRAGLAEAVFEHSEMRGCTLDGVGNPERLRGIAMPWDDVLRSAPTLAAGVGVRILDD
jgi:uncharacterized protein YjbI with pentapeptide repeats